MQNYKHSSSIERDKEIEPGGIVARTQKELLKKKCYKVREGSSREMRMTKRIFFLNFLLQRHILIINILIAVTRTGFPGSDTGLI